MGSKLPEFVLEMCPAYRDTCKHLDDDAFLASLSSSRKTMVRVLMRRDAVLLKQIKSSPDNLRMSGSDL